MATHLRPDAESSEVATRSKREKVQVIHAHRLHTREVAERAVDSLQMYYVHEFVCLLFVFFSFILDIKFVGRTSRGHTGGRSHRISHPPSLCGACLNFSREKDSAIPFPRRP